MAYLQKKTAHDTKVPAFPMKTMTAQSANAHLFNVVADLGGVHMHIQIIIRLDVVNGFIL